MKRTVKAIIPGKFDDEPVTLDADHYLLGGEDVEIIEGVPLPPAAPPNVSPSVAIAPPPTETVVAVIPGKFDDEPVTIGASHPLLARDGVKIVEGRAALSDAEASDDDEDDEDVSPYSEWSKAELQDECDARDIDYKSRATVDDLIALLEADDEE